MTCDIDLSHSEVNTHTTFEYGEGKLLPTQNLHSYVLLSLVWELLFRLPKDKHKLPPSLKTFDLQSVLPEKYARVMLEQNLQIKSTSI